MDLFFGLDHFYINLRHFCGIFTTCFFYLFIAFTMGYFSLGVGGGPERTECCVGDV